MSSQRHEKWVVLLFLPLSCIGISNVPRLPIAEMLRHHIMMVLRSQNASSTMYFRVGDDIYWPLASFGCQGYQVFLKMMSKIRPHGPTSVVGDWCWSSNSLCWGWGMVLRRNGLYNVFLFQPRKLTLGWLRWSKQWNPSPNITQDEFSQYASGPLPSVTGCSWKSSAHGQQFPS